MNNEQELQYFIAENPWLLNLNYENVPDITNKGIEYQIGNQQRIDLILRDKINKYPIIIEFKHTPFYRENIGQIIEYKARVINSIKLENSELYTVFGDYILCPKLILVVKECDSFFRVACNLSGIDIYEYKNISHQFLDPAKVVQIKNFTESYKTEKLPLTLFRGDELEKIIYLPIKKVLDEYSVPYAWTEPRGSTGFYYSQYNYLLINRWLFKSEIVSIGLYEDIFNKNDICISYYSNDKKYLKLFLENYNGKQTDNNYKLNWNDEWNEGNIEIRFNNNSFFENVESIFKKELTIYLDILRLIKNSGDNNGA